MASQTATAAEPFDPYAVEPENVQEPPRTLRGRFRYLGPGLILSAAVVGSGELITTTALGSQAVGGKWNLVIACYHDQGHAPFKAVYGDDGVNITVGLPVVRVSVDHGTAFDIAGKGIALEASLVLAVERAAELAPGWHHVWTEAQSA